MGGFATEGPRRQPRSVARAVEDEVGPGIGSLIRPVPSAFTRQVSKCSHVLVDRRADDHLSAVIRPEGSPFRSKIRRGGMSPVHVIDPDTDLIFRSSHLDRDSNTRCSGRRGRRGQGPVRAP